MSTMNQLIKTEKTRHLQDKIKLRHTKMCVEIWREAKQMRLPRELINELWALAEAAARSEWGEKTTLDDFTVEDRVVVENAQRRIEI